MKVDKARAPSAAGRTAAGSGSRAADSDAFTRALDSVTSAKPGAASSVAPTGAVCGVLAAQEVHGVTDREARRRAVRRGEALLDELEGLRRALLAGAVDGERLAVLSRMMRARAERVDDPDLAAVLAEIELRVEVELAKRSR